MQPGWIYYIYLLDKYNHTLYNTNDYPHKEPNMDDLVFSTVGKLYIELTRVQRIAEAQQARIAELEVLINSQSTTQKQSSKDGGKP